MKDIKCLKLKNKQNTNDNYKWVAFYDVVIPDEINGGLKQEGKGYYSESYLNVLMEINRLHTEDEIKGKRKSVDIYEYKGTLVPEEFEDVEEDD